MNDLLALASAVRERYLEALLESLVKFMGKHRPSAPEVMFELQRQEALPFRLYRADMAANVNGAPRMQDVNPSSHLGFEPFGIEFSEGATAAVHPFVWNDVGVQINVTMPSDPVEEWAMRWLDMEDKSAKDENGLQSVIHSVVREDAMDGSTTLTVDFGSAPVEALQEIIELAFACGGTHVSIRSESLQ
jgi:hypothetical protein